MTRRPRDRGTLRGARGVLVAICSAALAMTAHALADGEVPHSSTTVLLSVLIGWISTAAAEHTKGLSGILLVLGSGQLVTHLLLAELSGRAVGGLGMTASHASATLLTALVLAHAETMLAAAAATLRLLLPTVWRPAPVPPGRVWRARVRPADCTLAIDVLLRRVHGRRGPPVLS